IIRLYKITKNFHTDDRNLITFMARLYIKLEMIYEAIKIEESEKEPGTLNIYLLLMLSLATSIDALAVGLSFAFLKISIATPALVIGLVTFVLSFIGVPLGGRFGHIFESKIEILGGVILIGIGTKILLEHLGYLG
ncbi:MAG: manganese efflux pump, partial [Deltaproteobacteria bacterium]|nr:manganese efflux pump [Deltaproteobacteria bacterium]